MPDLNPYGLILVSSGSKGDKLLFRYPYRVDNLKETKNRGWYLNGRPNGKF